MERGTEQRLPHPGLSREEQRPVQLAPEGTGPLLQRDYAAVIEGSAFTPERVLEVIRRDFPSLSPSSLAEFTRPVTSGPLLEVGDTMHVLIPGAGHAAVMVALLEPNTMTLRTMQGHVEAGRITFGAYRDEAGRLTAHIRSISRVLDPPRFLGYWVIGKPAQTKIWTTFLERLAEACGGRVEGGVVTTTEEVEDGPADLGLEEAPTYSVGPKAQSSTL